MIVIQIPGLGSLPSGAVKSDEQKILEEVALAALRKVDIIIPLSTGFKVVERRLPENFLQDVFNAGLLTEKSIALVRVKQVRNTLCQLVLANFGHHFIPSRDTGCLGDPICILSILK